MENYFEQSKDCLMAVVKWYRVSHRWSDHVYNELIERIKDAHTEQDLVKVECLMDEWLSF
jgi:hypothetical protein